MELFTRVVELGGFSAAARASRMTPSAVSKLVSRLEVRLGARLFNRSTRKLQLTAEGEVFFTRCRAILADMDEAEREAAAGTAPRGRVRVNSNIAFGYRYLLPLVPEFVAVWPDVTLDIVLTDQVVDLLEERADVAIRTGPLRASTLVARKLGESRVAVVASPDYLARHGRPEKPADLENHKLITFNFARTIEGWPFLVDGMAESCIARGDVEVGDGETARLLALAGVGLARLSLFQTRQDIEEGRLVPVLEEFNPGDALEIYAVFVGQGGHLPARVRVLIDFLGERVDMRKKPSLLSQGG